MPLDHATPSLFRLAEWLADPARWDRTAAGLPDDIRDALAASPALRPLLNDWLAGQRGLVSLDLGPAFAEHLAGSEDLRLSVALLTATDAALLDAARFLGAAGWSDRMRRMVLRSDRQSLLEELGEEAMGFGLRRAPVIAKALADLPQSVLGSDPIRTGQMLCAAIVARGGAALAHLFRLRLPDGAEPVVLTERQVRAAQGILALRGIAA